MSASWGGSDVILLCSLGKANWRPTAESCTDLQTRHDREVDSGLFRCDVVSHPQDCSDGLQRSVSERKPKKCPKLLGFQVLSRLQQRAWHHYEDWLPICTLADQRFRDCLMVCNGRTVSHTHCREEWIWTVQSVPKHWKATSSIPLRGIQLWHYWQRDDNACRIC
jgi:hypothetical protein